jgi:hypothetical protein
MILFGVYYNKKIYIYNFFKFFFYNFLIIHYHNHFHYNSKFYIFNFKQENIQENILTSIGWIDMII